MDKTCNTCDELKSLDQFGRTHGTKYILHKCRECYKLSRKAYVPLDGLKSKLSRYGLSYEKYCGMAYRQSYVCAICGKDETSINNLNGKPNGLAIDHCHKTGKVRGLLCFSCNLGLGKFKDNTSLLQKAISYLEDNEDD